MREGTCRGDSVPRFALHSGPSHCFLNILPGASSFQNIQKSTGPSPYTGAGVHRPPGTSLPSFRFSVQYNKQI